MLKLEKKKKVFMEEKTNLAINSSTPITDDDHTRSFPEINIILTSDEAKLTS